MRRSRELTGAGMEHPWSARHRYMKYLLKLCINEPPDRSHYQAHPPLSVRKNQRDLS